MILFTKLTKFGSIIKLMTLLLKRQVINVVRIGKKKDHRTSTPENYLGTKTDKTLQVMNSLYEINDTMQMREDETE